jgi:hypothetical protein
MAGSSVQRVAGRGAEGGQAVGAGVRAAIAELTRPICSVESLSAGRGRLLLSKEGGGVGGGELEEEEEGLFAGATEAEAVWSLYSRRLLGGAEREEILTMTLSRDHFR